ncbi:MAG: methionyl-tRNA formyltransferase [Defluviitaleaceae bacterium]|nr:methionyl-tRNA formyltransferase [Defluviitaleaceae bacterium]
MKIVFMGTPAFAVPILQSLLDDKNHEIVAVVTQPDRPKGRGYTPTFSAVKECTIAENAKRAENQAKNQAETQAENPENNENNENSEILILQPEKVRNPEFIQQLQALQADVFVVVAYGQILPVKILNIPPLGCLNIHASLLPKYRGAAPMQWAMLNGDKTTGISIMYMDKGMDTGDVILQKEVDILPTDTFRTLHDKMQATSCECILLALQQITSGTAKRLPQDNEQATYAPMLTKNLGLLDWSKTSQQLYNQVRALEEWPGTYTYFRNTLLKIYSVEICENFEERYPNANFFQSGKVLENSPNLLIKTGDSGLYIKIIQKPNGKRMAVAEYLKGNAVKLNEIFGE